MRISVYPGTRLLHHSKLSGQARITSSEGRASSDPETRVEAKVRMFDAN